MHRGVHVLTEKALRTSATKSHPIHPVPYHLQLARDVSIQTFTNPRVHPSTYAAAHNCFHQARYRLLIIQGSNREG